MTLLRVLSSVVLAAVMAFSLGACGDDDGSSDGHGDGDGATNSTGDGDGAGATISAGDADGTSPMLGLSFTNLPTLGSDAAYEGWLIVDGEPQSTGTFQVDADGNPDPAWFEIDPDSADGASMFVLTIEPADDSDPGPSDTHVLAGGFDAGEAELTIGHDAALGTDLADASGAYVLNTPSSGDVDDDYDQGIWWLVPTDSGMVAGLELPQLPAGWVYEGWVVGDDGPITTGRFTAVDEADEDGAGPEGGSDDFPSFPGQDFVDPAKVLIGYTAVISVEPEPDDGPGPFQLKPLVDMDVEDLMPPATQSMANNAADSAISGSATLN